jgi:hypothetical protein
MRSAGSLPSAGVLAELHDDQIALYSVGVTTSFPSSMYAFTSDRTPISPGT